MPPKRKADQIANVDRKPNNKKLKLYTEVTPGKQLPLAWPTKQREPDAAKRTLAVIKEIWPEVLDPLAWYKKLDTKIPNDGKWFIPEGHQWLVFKNDDDTIDQVWSDRPCPELPAEIWFEIIKKVFRECMTLQYVEDLEMWLIMQLSVVNHMLHRFIRPNTVKSHWHFLGGRFRILDWQKIDVGLKTNKWCL